MDFQFNKWRHNKLKMKKIFLFMFVLLSLLSVSFGALLDDNQGYNDLDHDSLDSSGNSNTLINYGASPISAKLNNGYSCDGINDYFDVDSGLIDTINNFNNDFMIGLWIKTSTTNSYIMGTIQGTGSFALLYINAGKFEIRLDDGPDQLQAIGTSNINDNTWHYVVAQYIESTNTVKVYVDGNMETSSSNSAFSSVTLDKNFAICARNNAGTIGAFNVISIDELTYYNRSLSDSEILEYYNNGAGFNPYASPETTPIINHNVQEFYNSENISINLTATSNINMSYVLDYEDLIINNGLVAYYQAEGNANDRLNLNNGTWSGTETYSGSLNNYGSAFAFDGINSYVDISSIGTLDLHNSDYSICLVIYPTDSSKGSFLFGEGSNNDYIKFGNTGSVFIEDSIDTVFSNDYGAGFILNTWQHICFVFNSTADTINLCTDGTCRTPAINTLVTSYNVGNIGQSKLTEFYDGYMDEIKIYNRTLSTIEINTLYTTSPYINICNDCNTTTLNLYSLSEQGHNILFYATDLNGQTVTSSSFTIDLTQPHIEILNISDRLDAELNLTTVVNVTDFGSGLDVCTFNITYLENITNASEYNIYANCTDTVFLTANGKYSALVFVQDNAGNINTTLINGTFAPYVYVFFNDTVTDAYIGGYEATVTYSNGFIDTPTIQPDNSIIINPVQNHILILGDAVINFQKAGWIEENFTIDITFNITTPQIFNITRTTLDINMFDAVTLSQLTFDITILNATNSTTFTSQTDFSKLYTDVPTGEIELHISVDDYAETVFFFTLGPLTSLSVNGYLYKSNITSVHTFTLEEFASTEKLSGVLVEVQKLLNGSYTTLIQKLTSTNGIVFYNLDANNEYKIIFSKDGYVSSTATTIPNTLTYTVKLKEDTEAFEYIDTLSYSFTPTNKMLNDNETYSLTAFISDTSFTQTNLVITYGNGSILYDSTSTNPTGNTFVYNHFIPAGTNETKIIMTLNYIRDGVAESIVKEFNIISYTEGSMIKTFNDFGKRTDETSLLIKLFIMFIIITGVIIFGAILGVPTVNLMIVPVILGFTFVGWLDWVFGAVISFIAIVFFIGGRR